jgi:Fe2+ transport system protein FeoA
MSDELNLTQIKRGSSYVITTIADSSEYAAKLEKLGFTKGTVVERGLSNIKNPMIIKIRGSRIALRNNEAQIVRVRKLP